MDARGRRLLVRADASTTLGAGHVMRTLTLANAWRERGGEALFVCREAPGHLGDLVVARGHGLRLLPPEAAAPAQDALQTLQASADWRGATPLDWALVDHYGLAADWERPWRGPAARVAVIDDLADRAHDVDLLLDQNLGRQATDYDALVPAQARRLIGPAHALLRPEFAARRTDSLARRANGELRHLVISMGGSDPGGATARCLAALAAAPALPLARVTVVLGPQAQTLAQVRQALAALPLPTELRLNEPDMASLLASADLALGAAGGSAWERCCLGLPTLLLVLADNQAPGARALAAQGAALSLGGPDDLPQALVPALQALSEPARLLALSRAAAALCDGLGAARVVQALLDEGPRGEH
ncbi:UDP-2,4-diacetamido-2,4,6-trideoxy-beta-L-altropyranose hydrolase [Ideonella sp. 4Y16]|uniref:UDP-2,4-diacetamido-2,4, 6-trideoxy-beta-L-altropyranose hydrolase n=1 Tax=Ideonella alba TaxID=2824118 RepID=UPI001B35C802|nr:UDP-2,4-diacetamido-2,4,6-trideoxy-beta-L-altropyranose hydrolase [Ideonella alba]MBQ0941888.1 UDP-2,4-diacetamido-2,4,6-trideoxy-beta-L-altropyranose hydrolase [Ideonella alba]